MSKCTPCHRLFGFSMCVFLSVSILRIGDLGEYTFQGWGWVVLHIQVYVGLSCILVLSQNRHSRGVVLQKPSLCVFLLLLLWPSVLFSSPQLSASKPCPPPFNSLVACAGRSHLPAPRQLLAPLPSAWRGAEQDPCPAQPGTCTALQPARLFFTRLPSAKWEEHKVTL